MRQLCVVLLTAAVFGLTGCGDGKTKLTLNWKPEPEFGGFYAAQQMNLFKDHGLDIEIVPGGAGTPTIQLIAQGKTEFGVVSADEIIIARSRGEDVVAVFTSFQTNPQCILATPQPKVADLAELFKIKGLTLAIEPGRPYTEFLKKKYGFGDIDVVNFTGGVTGLIRAKGPFAQQGFVFSEPILARREGVEPQTFLIADSGYNPYTVVVAARGDYVRKNPKTVADFVIAVRAGWTAYQKDPAPANAVMGKLNPMMDEKTFAEGARLQQPLVEYYDSKIGALGTMSVQRWKTLIDQLTDLKIIDKPVAPQDCFIDPTKLDTGGK